jgi:hypothetical protein
MYIVLKLQDMNDELFMQIMQLSEEEKLELFEVLQKEFRWQQYPRLLFFSPVHYLSSKNK